MTQPGFIVSGVSLPTGMPDVFGIWAAEPTGLHRTEAVERARPPDAPRRRPEHPGLFSFAPRPSEGSEHEPGGSPTPSAQVTPQWRVDLPADAAAARAMLEAQQAAIDTQRAALGYARRILQDAEIRQKRMRRLRSLSQAFPQALAPATQPLPAPASAAEARLLIALNGGPGDAAPVLGLDIQAPWQVWQNFANEWQTFVDQVVNLFVRYADVETSVAGAPTGRTVVDWTGDFQTTWAPHAAAESMGLHLRSVHLALATRLALVHLVGTVAASAVTLVLASPTVIAFVKALPAVFQAVKEAMQEYLASQQPNPS